MSQVFREGFSAVLAVKDALQEAHHRGDLSTDRAREVLNETLDKSRTAAEVARERLNFISQADLDQVVSALDALNSRVTDLEKMVLSGSEHSRLEYYRDEPGRPSEGHGAATEGSDPA